MTFDELLDRAIEMLRRRGRLTYRTLRRQFELDDATLDDLTFELITGQQLAHDEDGQVLIWAGEADDPDASGAAGSGPMGSYAERRQLTVMFCDLVDSTSLASQIDPEDLRDVVQAYQTVCDRVIQRFEGYVAQYLGDGLLIYFGYPRAHEDDGQRAIRAALGILEAMQALNLDLDRRMAIELEVRIGIHTGLVVVGEIGTGSRREELALGEAPNVAARVQGLARPNTILVSGSTHRIIQGYFDCKDLGRHTFKGMADSIRVYRILGASEARSRLDAAGALGLTSLVGRERELDALRERWADCRGGRGHTVLLRGEAGIGKSRLVNALRIHADQDGATTLSFRCSPYYTNSALYPVIDHLQNRLDASPDPETKLSLLEDMLERHDFPLPEVIPLFASLPAVPLPDRYADSTLPPQRQKQQTEIWLVEWLLAEARSEPVLVVWEDLHWADPSTLDLIAALDDRLHTERLMLVCTFRPEFEPPWPDRADHIQLSLSRFQPAQIEQMIRRLASGKSLPDEVIEQIAAKTDGVPLFVEEVTKLLLESDLLIEADSSYRLTGPLPPLAVPSTLHDSLMARLDRLAGSREIAQLGAIFGREFSYRLIRAVSPQGDRELERGLRRLVAAELVYQTGAPPAATYVFKHALIQEIAYQSLLKSTRQHYHRQTVRVLEEQFPDTVTNQPELLAHHCTQAGLGERAIPYWQRAGQQALARSAHREASGHLRKALALIETLPDSRAALDLELDVQLNLGVALNATLGYSAPEVEQAYARARELCRRIGDTPKLFSTLYGLWRFYLLAAEYPTARSLGEQLLALAARPDEAPVTAAGAPDTTDGVTVTADGATDTAGEATVTIEAQRALASSLFYMGEFARSRQHLDAALACEAAPGRRSAALLYDVVDPWVTSHAYASWNLWITGAPEQAYTESQRAIALARDIQHPFSLALALNFASWLHQWRGESELAETCAREAVAISTEQGFQFWLGWGNIMLAWARAQRGDRGLAITAMRCGLDTWHATGSNLGRSYFLTLLADTLGAEGHLEAAMGVLVEASEFAANTGERFWLAEVHRQQGELMARSHEPDPADARGPDPADARAPSAGRAAPDDNAAAGHLRRALDLARQQGATALEHRARASLERLAHRAG